MTARERWTAVMERKLADRVPMDYWATPEATDRLLSYLGCDLDEMCSCLHIDRVKSVSCRYIGCPIDDGEDPFGVKFKAVSYGAGGCSEAINAPLAGLDSVDEFEAEYNWPSRDDWDASHLPDLIEGCEGWVTRFRASEPFCQFRVMRGMNSRSWTLS